MSLAVRLIFRKNQIPCKRNLLEICNNRGERSFQAAASVQSHGGEKDHDIGGEKA